jgi:proteasome lid subunit RPN8/RPN11
MLKIRRVALESALQAARNLYPNEFVGLFREERGILSELIIAPFSDYGSGHAGFQDFHLPPDPTLVATFHSHPGRSNYPSKGDLLFFSKTKKYHFIACIPFNAESVKAFNYEGREIGFELVE